MDSIGKVITAIVMGIVGLVGLLMTLCGGVFTVNAFNTSGTLGLLIISLPSLAVGVGAMWAVARYFSGPKGR
jgi:hypothetical protein